MLKKLLAITLLMSTMVGLSQVDQIQNLELRYNKRLDLVGFDTTLRIHGSLSEEVIYQRMIDWFRDDFQKLNVVISLKDSINDPNIKSDTGMGNQYESPPITNEANEYRIEARYRDYYQYKKIGTNNGLEICGRISIAITDQDFHFTMTHLNLPNFGFVPFEEEVLNENKSFRRTYRKLEPELCNKTTYLLNDLIFWVENYENIQNETDSWKAIESQTGKRKKRK